MAMKWYVGAVFGRIRITADLGTRGKHRYVQCLCECGTVKAIRVDGLQAGVVVSCGCFHMEQVRANGVFQPGNTIRPKNVARGPRNGQWKGDDVGDTAAHNRCQAMYPDPLGQCEHEGCGREAVDRHHVDGNPKNNARDNVRFLCRGCHQKEDGRAVQRQRDMADATRGTTHSPERRARFSAAMRDAHAAGKFDSHYARRGEDGRWQSSK